MSMSEPRTNAMTVLRGSQVSTMRSWSRRLRVSLSSDHDDGVGLAVFNGLEQRVEGGSRLAAGGTRIVVDERRMAQFPPALLDHSQAVLALPVHPELIACAVLALPEVDTCAHER